MLYAKKSKLDNLRMKEAALEGSQKELSATPRRKKRQERMELVELAMWKRRVKDFNVSVAVMKSKTHTFKNRRAMARVMAERRYGMAKYTPVLKCGRLLK